MFDADLASLDWRKSSYSATNGCVEVAHAALDAILVRDSKARNVGHLTFARGVAHIHCQSQSRWVRSKYLIAEIANRRLLGHARIL